MLCCIFQNISHFSYKISDQKKILIPINVFFQLFNVTSLEKKSENDLKLIGARFPKNYPNSRKFAKSYPQPINSIKMYLIFLNMFFISNSWLMFFYKNREFLTKCFAYWGLIPMKFSQSLSPFICLTCNA